MTHLAHNTMAITARKIFGPILLGVFCLGILGCSNPVAEQNHIPGQLLVHLAKPLSHPEAIELTEIYEIEFIEYFEYVRIVLVEVPEGQEAKWKEKLEVGDLIKSVSLVRDKITLR